MIVANSKDFFGGGDTRSVAISEGCCVSGLFFFCCAQTRNSIVYIHCVQEIPKVAPSFVEKYVSVETAKCHHELILRI